MTRENERHPSGQMSSIHSADGQKNLITKLQSQIESLQAQQQQHMNETRQQIKDLRRHVDTLKVRSPTLVYVTILKRFLTHN